VVKRAAIDDENEGMTSTSHGMRPVRKVVIPAAGLGTRFLPATKAQPKEMLPLIDRPAIQYVVDEAVQAGLRDLLIITGRSKRAIEDHFDRSPELEQALAQSGKHADLQEILHIAELANIHYVRQPEAKGLGNAVSYARHHVGDDPFVVMLGDDIMVDHTVLGKMVEAHQKYNCSVIAVKRFPASQISSYGCIDPGAFREDGLVELRGIVEKPSPEEAPSDLAVMGRYLFTPRIFDMIDKTPPGRGGEIQLTDAIGLLLAEEPVLGVVFEDGRYDIGSKQDFLRATVEFALRRPDLGADFREYLRETVAGWQ
jgi:UTP--glucose-1-phosphate uridylyltransferase